MVEAMNTLIQERHDHSENYIRIKVSRGTRKIEIVFTNKISGLDFLNTDLVNIFGSNVGNEFGVMLRGKGPHKLEFVYECVHRHSLMIYTHLIGYKNVRDTHAPLLRCFSFNSKLRAADYWTVYELSDI